MIKINILKTFTTAIIISLFTSVSYAMVVNGNEANKVEYDPHAIVVKFKPRTISLPFGGALVHPDEASIRPASIKELNNRYKVEKLKKIFRSAQEGVTAVMNKRGKLVRINDLSGYYKIYFPSDLDVIRAINDYKNDPNVESVEFDYKVHMMEVPSDTSFNLQWGLSNEGQSGGTVDADIDAPEAWNVNKGTSEVIIAVVDSGVDTNHPDLASKLVILPGCNFVEGGNDPNPVPGGGPNNNGIEHGTHVAGIAAAVTDNAVAGSSGGSVAGVGWNCKIMPVKVLNAAGSGTLSDVAAGIDFAASNGADVINMSLGGGFIGGFFQTSINNAYSLGCVIVAAAGNSNNDISTGFNRVSPVCNDGGDGVNRVVGVAGTNDTDTKAWYSNYSSTYVDVSAPGGDTTSSSSRGIYSTVFNNGTTFTSWYKFFQGTSMATPFVSGLAALLKSQHPTWGNDEIIATLKQSTDYIDGLNLSYAGKLGTGRINAHSALTLPTLVIITQPRQSSVVYGLIQVEGSATWEGSGFYRLLAGPGSSPTTFEELATSTTPVANGFLGNWDTSGLGGPYTLKLIVNDLSTLESSVVVNVGTSKVNILGEPVSGPNPFNPRVNPKYVFYYKLSSNASTSIHIYDTHGAMLWKKTFAPGSDGGRQGDNKPEWDGKSHFGGGYLANGVYLYQIISGDAVIGRGKILIFK